MRVECQTIDDFLTNLSAVKPVEVFGNVVYVTSLRDPLGGNKFEAVKFRITFQAAAVIDCPDGQYLLCVGEDCGVDYKDQGGELKGSELAGKYENRIGEFCRARGLAVRPGRVFE